MLLFSHILIMRAQPGTLISMKKLKRRCNRCKINAIAFDLDL